MSERGQKKQETGKWAEGKADRVDRERDGGRGRTTEVYVVVVMVVYGDDGYYYCCGEEAAGGVNGDGGDCCEASCVWVGEWEEGNTETQTTTTTTTINGS